MKDHDWTGCGDGMQLCYECGIMRTAMTVETKCPPWQSHPAAEVQSGMDKLEVVGGLMEILYSLDKVEARYGDLTGAQHVLETRGIVWMLIAKLNPGASEPPKGNR